MFTWEKVKWSICIYWAQFWRGGVLGLVGILVGVFLLLVPAFLNLDDLAQYKKVEIDIKIAAHIVY
jgi:hypothetical protein